MKQDRKLHLEIEAVKALKSSLAAYADDEELIIDTIEGETNLLEMIDAMVHDIAGDQERVAGIKDRMEDLSERRHRFERRIEARRAMIEQAMSIAEIKSLERDEATLSLRSAAPSPIIESESDIPATFWKAQPPKLDRRALAEALKSGEDVPGARLNNGGLSLSIRRK